MAPLKYALIAALLLSAFACALCQDLDGDGECDLDNCPGVYNPDQGDDDGDGLGNACDPDYLPPAPSPAPSISPEPDATPEAATPEPGAQGAPDATPSASPKASEAPEANETLEATPTVNDPKALPPRVTPEANETAVAPPPSAPPEEFLSFGLGERTVSIPLPPRSEWPWFGLLAVILAAGALYYYEREQREEY